jgi:hypothetical protein
MELLYAVKKDLVRPLSRLNMHLKNLVNIVLEKFADELEKQIVIENAVEFIEKNTSLLKYSDLVLYEHQKEIFTVIKRNHPKLIMYMAHDQPDNADRVERLGAGIGRKTASPTAAPAAASPTGASGLVTRKSRAAGAAAGGGVGSGLRSGAEHRRHRLDPARPGRADATGGYAGRASARPTVTSCRGRAWFGFRRGPRARQLSRRPLPQRVGQRDHL